MFNPRESRDYVNSTKDFIQQLRRKLDEGERINKQRQDLLARVEKAREVFNWTELVHKAFADIQRESLKEDIEFKNRRLQYLADKITNTLSLFFPEDGYIVKPQVAPKRGMTTSLNLYTRDSEERLPYMSEGDHLQTQINLAACLTVIEVLGLTSLNIDEAFAASSTENLGKTQEMLREYIDRGLQIILISQRGEAFRDLPRVEIEIDRDTIKNRSFVSDVRKI